MKNSMNTSLTYSLYHGEKRGEWSHLGQSKKNKFIY